jgi:hypothetical protein
MTWFEDREFPQDSDRFKRERAFCAVNALYGSSTRRIVVDHCFVGVDLAWRSASS